MNKQLLEAARAAADALDGAAFLSKCYAQRDTENELSLSARNLRDAIEAAEKAQPVAYRIECKWRDPRLDQTWRKYSDYGTRKAAESSQQVFANRGDIEARIVPLYAGEPEESR